MGLPLALQEAEGWHGQYRRILRWRDRISITEKLDESTSSLKRVGAPREVLAPSASQKCSRTVRYRLSVVGLMPGGFR